MKEIIVKTQAELDAALVAEYTDFTRICIHGGTRFDRLVVRSRPKNASVEAWGSSSVEAWGSSSVVARESSSVVAWESSSVVAWGAVAVHVHSESSKVSLFGFAVGIVLTKTLNVLKKSKTATIVRVKIATGVAGWLESQGIKEQDGAVVLYKRVSADFKTQENTVNETTWTVGAMLEHAAWNPKGQECGEGKFHACSRAYFCDEFRSTRGDRYVAIKVAKKDLYAWPKASYPHKVAFRKGTVLHECDRLGKKLTAAGAA